MSARSAAARAPDGRSIEDLIAEAIAALPLLERRPDLVTTEARAITAELAPVLQEPLRARWPPSLYDASWYGGRPRDERLHIFTRLLALQFERLTGQRAKRSYDPDFEFGTDFTGFVAAVLEVFGARDGVSHSRTGAVRRAVGVEPTRRANNTASYLVRVFASERKEFERQLSDRAWLARLIQKNARRPSLAAEYVSVLMRLDLALRTLEGFGWRNPAVPSIPALLHQGRTCRKCAEAIPSGRRIDAVFCSRKCQLRARRQRRG